MYIWEQEDWPRLTWQDGSIAALLAAVRHEQGRLIGRMEALGFSLRDKLYAHLQKLSLAFFGRQRTGDLLERHRQGQAAPRGVQAVDEPGKCVGTHLVGGVLPPGEPGREVPGPVDHG